MIVIEESGRLLLVGIVVRGGLPRRKPILRESVASRRRPATVKVHHGSNVRLAGFCPVQRVVHRKEMLFRQLVCPLHKNGLSATRLKGRAGARSVISPE